MCNIYVYVWVYVCMYADVNVGVLLSFACGGQRITMSTAPWVQSTLLFETRLSHWSETL